MEKEALQCERADDNLSALDIYEDICRSEWAGAKHLTALGHCYLKNRQRQNAKEAWLRAITYEPNFEPCIEALNKFFPGWQKQKAQQAAKSPVASADLNESPPPPPHSFDETQLSSLTMEMIPPTPAPEPPARAAAPEAPPPPGARPYAAPPPPDPRAARPPEPRPKAPPAPEPAPKAKPDEAVPVYMVKAPPGGKSDPEGRANWDFVLADTAEEAASCK
jgi:hypothetical protein